MALSTVDAGNRPREIVTLWKGQRGGLIPILQEMQKSLVICRKRPAYCSHELKIPKAEVYGVATLCPVIEAQGTSCYTRAEGQHVT